MEGKSASPKYYGGINNKFENVIIKGLDLNIRLVFSGGNYEYNYIEQRSVNLGNGAMNLNKDLIENSWTPDNKDAKYPLLVWSYKFPYSYDENGNIVGQDDPKYNPTNPLSFNYESTSLSRYLYRADYIRVKSIEIGYTIPKVFAENRLKLTSLRLFASANNVFVFSPFYKGWDPETGDRALPPSHTFNFGINIGL